MNLPTSAFEYHLPPELIAHHPARERDESRLMLVRREAGGIEHHRFRDLAQMIPAGDALVLNETRVFPARLLGTRPGGGEAEALLLAARSDTDWEALVRPGAKLRAGKSFRVADELDVEILEVLPNGNRLVRLHAAGGATDAIERHGRIPLPPYIERDATAEDAERYQTVYAREPGSVAAPTAGLHFTPALLEVLERSGVRLVRLVLHVGVGTFRPVEVEDPAEHVMHEERFRVSDAAAAALNEVRGRGGRIWAVGTTVTRTLESVVSSDGVFRAGTGSTNLFIRPGYTFRAIDRLITNFHLPRSTLLMLVAAFGGYDLIMRAYREAVHERYRFYSYGDAMVIV